MIRVGVVGVGEMGKNHARIYRDIPDIELVGVADTNSHLAQRVAECYQTVPYTDFRELLNQGINAVSIAVPTVFHREIAIEAARHGVDILVEKPIASSVKAGMDIIQAARDNNVKLMVGHIERFNPLIQAIKKEIENEEIVMIEITRIGPFPPRIKDVGVVIDLAVHDIDLIQYLTKSDFECVNAVISRNGNFFEDAAILIFKMRNGCLARVTVNWLTPFKVREINIATKHKCIRGSLSDQKGSTHWKSKENDWYASKEIPVKFAEPLRLELEAFLQCVRNNTRPPISGEDGLGALEIALKCLNGREARLALA
jgi:predicted dehydrogenase